LSSTLCGVGAAQSRRVMRGEDARLARDVSREYPWMAQYLTDVSDEVNTTLDHEGKVLIEGTQGFGLSLYHSDHYPKTTSRDTTAAAFLSEVGVSPCLVSEVVVVFRTFPIRVAGDQAGPMENEIDWEQLRVESGYPYPIEERTSVTHKVRRVARFDHELAQKAILHNRPTRLAINGLDLIDFKNVGIGTIREVTSKTRLFLDAISSTLRTTIHYAGIGPKLSEILQDEGVHNLPREDDCVASLQTENL